MEGMSYESDMLDDPNDWYRSSDPLEFDLDNYNQMYLEDSPYGRGYRVTDPNDPNNPLRCKICNFVFKRKSNLTKHTLTRHSIEKPFKCDKCPYTASLIGYLKRHRRVHERTVEDDFYKCDLCSYRTHLMSNLRSHSITHLGYKPFKCELCGFLTTHENYLTKHMTRKHPEPPIEPEIPPLPPRKTFLDEENGEIDVVGGDREVYDEELNGDAESDEEVVPAPPTEEDLEELRKSTVFLTTGTERKYKCDQCGFSTHNKLRFKEHSSVHTGQYPYKCIHCNYRTARKYDFDQHKRSHSRQTGFKCQRCNIYFKWKCDLQGHMSKHVKPRAKRQYVYQPEVYQKSKKAEPKMPIIFQCDECDANYATNKSYRRHKQQHMLGKAIRMKTKTETSPPSKEPVLPKPKEPSMKSSYHFCLKCNVTFRSRRELNLHKTIHYRTCRLKLHRLPEAKDYFTIGSIHTPVEPNYPNPVIRISSRAGPYSKKIARIYKTTTSSSLTSILNLTSVPPVISYPSDIFQLEPFWTNKEPIYENIAPKAGKPKVSNSMTNIDLSESIFGLDDVPKPISGLDDVSEPISNIFDDGISGLEPINVRSEKMVSIEPMEKSNNLNIKTESLVNALQDIDVNVACNSSTQTEALSVPIKSEIIKTEHVMTGDDLDFWIEGEESKPDSEVLDVICLSDSDSEDEKKRVKLPEDDSAMLRQYILQSAAKDIASRIINNGKRAALVMQETDEAPTLTSARIYRCDKCDYQIGQKFAFKKHLKLHWEKRKYACDLCGLRFKRRLRLSQHKFDHK